MRVGAARRGCAWAAHVLYAKKASTRTCCRYAHSKEVMQKSTKPRHRSRASQMCASLRCGTIGIVRLSVATAISTRCSLLVSSKLVSKGVREVRLACGRCTRFGRFWTAVGRHRVTLFCSWFRLRWRVSIVAPPICVTLVCGPPHPPANQKPKGM